jgi:hypothetical protein
MKQTAVEFLVDKLSYSTSDGTIISHHFIINKLVDQAKEIERQQIVDFAYVIADDLADGVFRDKEAMEKRYNEFLTFRSEEDESNPRI